jgi:Zn-dependent M28 family amino/carboxypeptidase
MSPIREITQEISIEKMKTHIQNLEGIRHPVFAPAALEKAANYIEENLRSFGLELSLHHFTEDDKQYPNIIGLHPGTKQADKKVIVLAHFDTVAISPGADDNASGVAAMLELARVLQPCSFEKSILFIGVNLEEQKVDLEPGTPFLRGSKALAAFAQQHAWEIEGVVNFETIACAGEDVIQQAPANLPFELPKVGNFIAVIGNEKSTGMVQDFIGMIQQYQIPLPFVPLVVPGNGEVLPDSRRSDHATFWDIGAPAIMLTDTANFRTPHYHQASDTLETLNLTFAANVCRSGAGLVCQMARIINS